MDHRCYKLASSLRRMGFEPIILCDKPRHALGEAWSGFDIRILSPVSHLDSFAKAFAIFHLRLFVTLLFTRSKTWISLDCPPLFTLAAMGKLRGAEVVYDSHELFPETPMVLSRPARKRFWTLWHDAGVRLVRRIIAVSPACADWFARKYPGHALFLLPNAPPLKAQAPVAQAPSGSQGIRLIFQGGLRVASGLPETFAAMALPYPGMQELSLDIYGDGPERPSLEAAAQRCGVQDRVRFHGQVPFEALREPMGRAHIGIHLMQPVCGSFALTLANKLFDYAHAGLPVLLSDNPSHQALLRDSKVGVAVDSFSPEAIAKGLQALVEGWDGFHGECLRAREIWHWETFADDLPSFLENCTSNLDSQAKPKVTSKVISQ